MKCSKCGNNVNPGEKFCGVCGNPLTLNNPQGEDNTPVEESPVAKPAQRDNFIDNNKKPSSNKGVGIIIAIFAVIVAVMLIVVAVVAFKIFGGKGGSTDQTSYYAQDAGIIGLDVADSVGPEIVDPANKINEIDSSRISSIINGSLDYTDFGIYVHNLENDYEFTYYADDEFLASAMCQVVILDTLSRTVQENHLDIDDEEIYFSYMANGKESPTSKNEDKSYVPLKRVIEDVAVYGDNNKSNHIVDYIGSVNGVSNGFDVINDTLRSNGYYNTEINRKTFVDTKLIDNSASPNVTTPREIGEIFENLIKGGGFGTETYMKNIFKSVSNDGTAIGLKKYVPAYYSICNANALNNQSTNNVAIISDGDTEIVVAILSTTDEDMTDVEDNGDREKVQEAIIDYILETQFMN